MGISSSTSIYSNSSGSSGLDRYDENWYDVPRRGTPVEIVPVYSPTIERALRKLREFDTVIVVDNSASMSHHRRKVAVFVDNIAQLASKYTQHGFDLHFVSGKAYYLGLDVQSLCVVRDAVDALEYGEGDLYGYLDWLLRTYYRRYEDDPRIKPVNFIIITDGASIGNTWPPTCLIQAAEWVKRQARRTNQIGFQFVQVCTSEAAQRRFEQLDDNLGTALDIVDTTRYEDPWDVWDVKDVVKVLLGAINRNVDKKGAKGIYTFPLPGRELS
ncbi:hypothetical protein AX16_007758 [Volvariella volvacea WC 439]|nr:hypothetical protein AX16_007758 [Volvariella volvacea WC 439]